MATIRTHGSAIHLHVTEKKRLLRCRQTNITEVLIEPEVHPRMQHPELVPEPEGRGDLFSWSEIVQRRSLVEQQKPELDREGKAVSSIYNALKGHPRHIDSKSSVQRGAIVKCNDESTITT